MAAKYKNDKRLQHLHKGSKKLQEEVKQLEDALQLQQRFHEIEDSSVRGMIRKEIGGSIWQHGASGKLRTYKSTKDLEDGTENMRQKTKSTSDVRKTGSVINMTHSKKESNGDLSTLDVRKTGSVINMTSSKKESNGDLHKPSRKNNKDTEAMMKSVSNNRNHGNLLGEHSRFYESRPDSGMLDKHTIGNYNLDRVEAMKSKVIEKASANVIQRKKISVKQKEENEKRTNSDTVRNQGKENITKMKEISKTSKRPPENVTKKNSDKMKEVLSTDSENVLKEDVMQSSDRDLKLEGLAKSQNSDSKQNSTRNSSNNRTSSSNFPKQTNRLLSADLDLLAKSVAINGSNIFTTPNSGASRSSSWSPRDMLYSRTDSSQSSPKCDPRVILWLRNLGLIEEEKYIHIFAENEIDMEELVRLNGEHLKNIGVVAVGAYNKILRGIEELQQKQTENSQNHKMSPKSEINVTGVKVNTDSSKNMAEVSEMSGRQSQSSRPIERDKSPPKVDVISAFDNTSSKPKLASDSTSTRPRSAQSRGRITRADKTANDLNKSDKKGTTTIQESESKQNDKPTKSDVKSQKPKKKRERVTDGKGSNSQTQSIKTTEMKISNTGVNDAARKLVDKHKQETENQRKQEKLKERQKQHRDELARKHEERERHREEIALLHMEREKNRMTVESPDDYWTNPELTMSDLIVDSPQAVEPSLEKKERRQRSKSQKSRLSIAVPANAIELTSEEIGKNMMLASYVMSSRPPKPRALSPRKSQSKTLESQIEKLRTRAQSGDLVTMGLVKDLQLRLDQLEDQITVKNSHMMHRSRSNRKDGFFDGQGHTNGFSIDDVLKMKHDFKTQSQVKPANNLASSVKHDLLEEIRKEKNEHKKQLRHLQSELSKINSSAHTNKAPEVSSQQVSFSESDLIGEGTFSRVYRGIYQNTEVALKQLKIPLSSQDKNYFAAEVSLLRDLNHPRVVRMMGVCTTDGLPVMILEYMARGSLYHQLHNVTREELDHVEYFRIAHDIALGMSYLHHHKPAVLHLDLKSMNVLLCSNYRAKIADFGFSKLRHDADVNARKTSKNKPIQGSPAWMAPELLETGEITPKADVYSFGIILWEMLTREQPYKGCSVFQILECVRRNKRPDLPETCPSDLNSFIQDCWHTNPARRPSFKEILSRLDSLAFPSEWRDLFEEAGIPQEALEDVQSARTIISLVNTTLDTENVKTLVQDIEMSLEEMPSQSKEENQYHTPLSDKELRLSLQKSNEKQPSQHTRITESFLSSPAGHHVESLQSDRSLWLHKKHPKSDIVTSKSLDENPLRSHLQRSHVTANITNGSESITNQKHTSRNGENNGRQRCSSEEVVNVRGSQVYKNNTDGADSLNSTLETESLPSMDLDSLEDSEEDEENNRFEDSLKLAESLNSGKKVLNIPKMSEIESKDREKTPVSATRENEVQSRQADMLELCYSQGLDKSTARLRLEKSAGSSDKLLSELNGKLKNLQMVQNHQDNSNENVSSEPLRKSTKSESTRNSTKLESTKNSTKLESTRNSTKLESTRNSTKLESTRNSSILESKRNSTELESARNSSKFESIRNSTTLESTRKSTKLDTARRSVTKMAWKDNDTETISDVRHSAENSDSQRDNISPRSQSSFYAEESVPNDNVRGSNGVNKPPEKEGNKINSQSNVNITASSDNKRFGPGVVPPPPPPPPLPGTTPRQHSNKRVFISPMGVNCGQFSGREVAGVKVKPIPEDQATFLLKSNDLKEQKDQLVSTSKPHPNQLQDLSTVNKVTINSIAEILKKAVSNRRTAMGEDTGSPPLSVASSWSYMDE